MVSSPRRFRGILKWAGIGACLTIFATWVFSLHFMLYYTEGYSSIGISGGSLNFVTPTGYPSGWYLSESDGGHGLGLPRSTRFGMKTTFSTPMWLLFILIMIPTAFLMYPDRRRYRPGHCQQCGYDLTGNTSGICPECGTKVTV
ncbi:MAG: hypothetical protein MI923_11595 [Phycisphaerales bacterium]|nr:hypothetical protein [Phycisphaerales bacterium]